MITFFSLFAFYFSYDFYRYDYFKSAIVCFFIPIIISSIEFIDYFSLIGYGLGISLAIGYILAVGYCMISLVSSKPLGFALVLICIWPIVLFDCYVRKPK